MLARVLFALTLVNCDDLPSRFHVSIPFKEHGQILSLVTDTSSGDAPRRRQGVKRSVYDRNWHANAFLASPTFLAPRRYRNASG